MDTCGLAEGGLLVARYRTGGWRLRRLRYGFIRTVAHSSRLASLMWHSVLLAQVCFISSHSTALPVDNNKEFRTDAADVNGRGENHYRKLFHH